MENKKYSKKYSKKHSKKYSKKETNSNEEIESPLELFESDSSIKSDSSDKNDQISQINNKENQIHTNLDIKFTEIFSQNTKLKFDFELCSVFQPDFF
ncbi:hypothetical protein M0811_00859 [Anaeramoeba ignava]|uniref:Uncharacterized protein n=1 Tax=Anaeramoeba ignava TaxID=1746090 RepID=A0A9Q0LKM6_ANAIG|nr:hypothetical protein M0811_00859 [Anaeramoeba ignava]